MSSDDASKTSPQSSLEHAISQVLPLQKKFISCSTLYEKQKILSDLQVVREFFENDEALEQEIADLPAHHRYLVEVLVALGQGNFVFGGWQQVPDFRARLAQTVELLSTIESFYDYIGGIVGYHILTLKLISEALSKKSETLAYTIAPPPVIDIREESIARAKMVAAGCHALEQMAEIYVVGGAGERLALVDEKTLEPLPVACLVFAGRTLLEHLVRDLEARESLVYKLTAKQSITPIVLMTSLEKQNDAHIVALLEKNGYFGRPKERFLRVRQPMVPVLTVDGMWAVRAPLDIIVKPGGHGVIWKLAEDQGAFSWLENHSRSYCIVRQINNPLAGLDYNLLALAGYGHLHGKSFGFESIPRLPNMAEGMNVLKKWQSGSDILCSISNIEYTEFQALGKMDEDFPANTNILYANLKDVRRAVKKMPVPGLIVNMKQSVGHIVDGKMTVTRGARLESTMQNIADAITNRFHAPLKEHDFGTLHTFVLLNDRKKTMSVTKKAFDGTSLKETPEGCYNDLIHENLRLLQSYCQFEVDADALFLYHPALGPLYSIIAQKISRGRLSSGSELVLEASEVSITDLYIDGSLLVLAERVTGVKDPETGELEYTPRVGRVVLENVRVKNKGINREAKNSYVRGEIERKESLRIILQGDSECIAKNVTLVGDKEIVVAAGTRCIISQSAHGNIEIVSQDIRERHPDSVCWKYHFDEYEQIILSK